MGFERLDLHFRKISGFSLEGRREGSKETSGLDKSYGLELSLLASLGCHNKNTQSRWLRQQRFIFSRFWRLGVQHHGASRVDAWQEDSCLLAVCSRGLSLVCTHGEREGGSSSFKDTNPIRSGP